jgi:hypothetical protein
MDTGDAGGLVSDQARNRFVLPGEQGAKKIDLPVVMALLSADLPASSPLLKS